MLMFTHSAGKLLGSGANGKPLKRFFDIVHGLHRAKARCEWERANS